MGNRGARINRERARRVRPWQWASFEDRAGVQWIRIVSDHDRSSIVERPATPDDLVRFAAFLPDGK